MTFSPIGEGTTKATTAARVQSPKIATMTRPRSVRQGEGDAGDRQEDDAEQLFQAEERVLGLLRVEEEQRALQ